MDQKLIAEYLAGDEESLEILIKKYLKPIYSFVYRYVGNSQDAEDITQETFVRSWKNLKKFDQEKSFKTWIFSIAKNAAIDWIRKKKTVSLSDEIINNFADPKSFTPKFSLSPVLKKLPPQYRKIFFLRYNDHLTFREIAEVLEESINTIKTRYRRGIVILRKILTE